MTRHVGMGCMRLSTAADRNQDRAIETIHCALDHGVTLLDTANAYCHGHNDVGHNERLIARALSSWAGDRSKVTVATKGGLTRPGGKWIPDGRAKSLTRACEASVRALGVDQIDLYQLHAPDPRTPLATSVRALAKMQRDGLVRDIGLCNVSVGQIEEARAISPIAAVQVELSLLSDRALRSGVADYCRDHDILLLAHTPLGSPKKVARLDKVRALREVAARRSATPAEIALAWVANLAPQVVAIPGATRPDTARSGAGAQQLALEDEDWAILDEHYASSRRWRVPRSQRRPDPEAPADVVVLMGLPGAGKSSAVASWVERGYARLNRDERGGTLSGLAKTLDAQLSSGQRRFVLDNTYGTRTARNDVIEVAWEHGVNVRCAWLQTSLEDAQINAVTRMIERHGRLLSPEEMSKTRQSEPTTFPPQVQFDYRRGFEAPVAEEGFSEIEMLPFSRRLDPSWTQRALILEYDEVLRRSKSGARSPVSIDDIEILPGRTEVLRRHVEEGWILVGISWQPEVEEGVATEDVIDACFRATHERLGVEIDVSYCPHRAGPPRCWCRKPLPGLGVRHIVKHRLDPARCLAVGRNAADRTFAERLGFGYAEALFG